jgi:2-amino-4-hydroxy-6-hydroxymethyldihydropteridine diphosphokinase
MTTAYIALGSNLGDRLANLGSAIGRIAELPETHVRAISHAYDTEPAYHLDQPAYANGVVAVETELSPEQLLALLQSIEDDMGRVRAEPNGPRVIDLDILLFGDEEMASETLVIPHPRLLERDFVVTPLLDVAPRLHLPDGTHVKRENATVGLVVGDLGPIPHAGVVEIDPNDAEKWTVVAENTGETLKAEPPMKAPAIPTPRPRMPPMMLVMTAYTRNCTTMFRRVAPTARLTPISRVRSRTVTSITLATPMPPTTRLIAAMAAISLVRVLVLDETAVAIELAFTI